MKTFQIKCLIIVVWNKSYQNTIHSPLLQLPSHFLKYLFNKFYIQIGHLVFYIRTNAHLVQITRIYFPSIYVMLKVQTSCWSYCWLWLARTNSCSPVSGFATDRLPRLLPAVGQICQHTCQTSARLTFKHFAVPALRSWLQIYPNRQRICLQSLVWLPRHCTCGRQTII